MEDKKIKTIFLEEPKITVPRVDNEIETRITLCVELASETSNQIYAHEKLGILKNFKLIKNKKTGERILEWDCSVKDLKDLEYELKKAGLVHPCTKL